MPSILIAECMQEVSSFNPILSHYHDFVINTGNAIIKHHQGIQSEVAGALSVFTQQPDIQLVPTYSAKMITSGGTLATADYRRIAQEFLDSIHAAPPVDGVYFALHGAMASEIEPDPEGYLLAETRRILGDQVPIVASFDLHGILTDRILENADAIVLYHTYPHIDFFQTGARAARLLLSIMRGEVAPVTAKVEIPALVRGDELITSTGLFGGSIRRAQAIESSAGGLSAGMFIGNPFTDVPDLRSYSVVVTDNDPVRAAHETIEMATEFWAVRQRLQQPLTPLREAVEMAKEAPSGTVILVDAADATSSGASGDSNAILRALLEQGYSGKALIPIVDPAAVEKAFAAGIGSTIYTDIGGALDARRFKPVEVEAMVRMLSDGDFENESNGAVWHGGKTAVLQAGKIVLVVTSRPVHLFDRSLFLAHGQDPRRFDLVVVKSPHCQEHFFKSWATKYINVDAPGATSANLQSLGHTVCRRPVFPLDENVEFQPQVKIFRRNRM